MTGLLLVTPDIQYIDGYTAALEQGWSPDNLRPEAAREKLAKIKTGAAAFCASFDDREARGDPIVLPDGSTVQRLPGFQRWLWDGEFCGVFGFRGQPGTEALPPTCLGHIGYSVVPRKRGLGYATRGLALLLGLPELRATGLAYVELTADIDNLASQKVILGNGGRMVERFTKLPALGGGESFRFRIDLPK